MFKKVKSLLVAGLLVAGMSGSVFAANPADTNENWTEIRSEIEAITGGDIAQKVDGVDHYYVEDEDGVTKHNFETSIVQEIESRKKDGLVIAHEEINDDRGYQMKYLIYNDNNYDNSADELLMVVLVDWADDVVTENGWDIGITPETGDTIALGGLVVAGVAVGALALNNKKKNKK